MTHVALTEDPMMCAALDDHPMTRPAPTEDAPR